MTDPITTPAQMREAAALLPCPFCGGKAERITLGDEEPANKGGDVITCQSCGASSHVEFGRKENLVYAWNRRATPIAEVEAERDQWQESCQHLALMIENLTDQRDAALEDLGRIILTLPTGRDMRIAGAADGVKLLRAGYDAALARIADQEKVLREILEWSHRQLGVYPEWIDRLRRVLGLFDGDAGPACDRTPATGAARNAAPDAELEALVARLEKLADDMERHATDEWDESEDVRAAIAALRALWRRWAAGSPLG